MFLPDGSTQLLALFGGDLKQSPSPQTHTAWAQHLGLNWVYVPLTCNDETAFLRLCNEMMLCPHFQGGNITNPFKRTALQLAGVECDQSAEMCGAANTLYRVADSGRPSWRLANTDLQGCSETLSKILSSNDTQTMSGEPLTFVILGTGAMADTCAQAIALMSGHCHHTETITLSRNQLKSSAGKTLAVRKSKSLLVVINTLPSGTHAEADQLACAAIENLNAHFEGSKHLFEVSYLQTNTIRKAASLGWHTLDGELLFEEQARASFKLWARCSAPSLSTALRPSRG